MFDFTVTPPGFEWLDEFAQQASDVWSQLVAMTADVLVLDGVVTAALIGTAW